MPIKLDKGGMKLTLKRTLAYLVLYAVIFLMVDGMLQELQMIVLNGKIVIPSISIKVVLVAAILVLAFFKREDTFQVIKNLDKTLLMTWLLFGLYLIIETCIFKFAYNLPLSYSVFNYNAYFFCLIILPAIYLFKTTIKEKAIVMTLVVLFIPLFIIGFLQFILNSPILPTESMDHNFNILSWNYYGRTRAFSLFISGLSFGHFISLIVGIVITLIFNKRGKSRIYSVLVLILSIIAGYTTLTRNSYIEIFITIVSAIIFNLNIYKLKLLNSAAKRSAIFMSFLPLIYGLIGLLLTFGIPLIGHIMTKLHVASSLFQTDSTQMRYNEWLQIYNILFSGGPIRVLFGTGWIQNSTFSFTKDLIVDNSFLAVGLDIGLIGVIFWIALMWIVWRKCLKIAQERRDALSIGVVALFSTWMIVGIFNISLIIYILAFYLLLIAKKESCFSDNREL